MEDRAGRIPGVEPVPGKIVLAGVFRARDPLEPADRHDVGAVGQERSRLLGLSPVGVNQQPGRGDRLEMVQELPGVGRIRNDAVDIAVAIPGQRVVFVGASFRFWSRPIFLNRNDVFGSEPSHTTRCCGIATAFLLRSDQ